MQKSLLIQDAFLKQVQNEGLVVCLNMLDGTKLRGTVQAFDSFVLMFEDAKEQQFMIYKHAIASVTPDRNVIFPAPGK